ncbi:hypothetical protein [uncultured Winogradskyella sp.]|uniref:hypothetical protein n=1 Tax=uncultured Winogradskyella sp. TaxID=395353 RepID=UPI002614E454|nr:hypothetical protein [uncultured Winogradskyella sp.]|tara:strand:+ start:195 stop:521 length:327 start_codon:yes stop_codon:yes gene_type:complete
MIIISKYLVPRGYIGITIFPFMILKSKVLKGRSVLINHERIHLRQQIELLIIPFLLIYILEFLIRLVKYRNWNLAYRNISFEREAYINEKDLDYLKSRPFFNFLNYFN